jgi:hypothetical protein
MEMAENGTMGGGHEGVGSWRSAPESQGRTRPRQVKKKIEKGKKKKKKLQLLVFFFGFL